MPPTLEKISIRDLLALVTALFMTAGLYFSLSSDIMTLRYELSHWKGRTTTLEGVQRADHDQLMILNGNLNTLIEKFEMFIDRTDDNG